jgi:hypothetical protein
MASSDFQVNVQSGVSNPDIRNLTDTEKSMARAMGITEEQFRQNKFAYLASEERRRERGRDLGEVVDRFLSELGEGYRVVSVTCNLSTPTWRLEIATPDGARNVVLSWELVDYVLDARTQSEFQRLQNMVFFGLGRQDVIFGDRQ